MTEIAIIGGGLAGLTAASVLSDVANVRVFEKSRGVGGRMSTRRTETFSFDHGAQYFTVRTQAFRRFLEPLFEEGIVSRWDAQIYTFDGTGIVHKEDWGEEEARYVGVPTMSAIVKRIAKNISVMTDTRVTSLERQARWLLRDDQGGMHGDFDWVLCTAPAPQTSELMPNDFKYKNDIDAVEMSACYALMVGLSNPLALDFQGARIRNSDLSWIALDGSKPGRKTLATLVAHSTPAFAEQHWNAEEGEVIDKLLSETARVIGTNLEDVTWKAIHKWRFANNVLRNQLPVLVDERLQLGVCGDWCSGGRVEGAFTAAWNVANRIREELV